MRLNRNDVKIGSIIETTGKQSFRVIDPDSSGGVLCNRFVKSRQTWAKSTTWYEYGKDYYFTNITK